MIENKINQNQPVEKINLERYKDLDGLTMKKLDFGLWFVAHIKLIKKSMFWLLMVAGTVSWVYFIYSFGFYVVKGMKEDDLLLSSMVAIRPIDHKLILSVSAQQIQAGEVQVFNSSGNKYDFLVKVNNPSQRHWADLVYYFIIDGQPTEKISNFIYPNEEKYLTLLSKELNTKPSSVVLRIDSPVWHIIDTKKITNWEKFKSEHLNIEIENSVYVPPRTSGLSEKINLGQVGFTASNFSPYNYWKMSFTTLLYSYGSVVGVNRYFIENFMSGQLRSISANYPGQFGRIDKLEVVPEVNILDQNVYQKFTGDVDLPIEEVQKK